MVSKYSKMLNRKTPISGENLGKLLLYCEAEDIKGLIDKNAQIDVLPRDKIQERINALNDNENLVAFNNFVGVNNFIRYAYNTCLGHKEVARNRLNAIETSIIDIAGFANRVRLFNSLPVIMTSKQAKVMEQDINTGKGFESWNYGIYELVAAYIADTKARYDKGTADKKFNDIMERYKATPIPAGLKPYINKIWGESEDYYIKDAPFPMRYKRDLLNALRYRNIKPLKEIKHKEWLDPLTYNYIKEVAPDEAFNLIKVVREENETDKIKTLYDFIDNINYTDIHELGDNDITPKDVIEPYFKDLYEYAVRLIDSIKGLERFKCADATITLPELAKLRILNYRDFLTDKVKDAYGVKDRGVAVIDTAPDKEVDANGYYKCSQQGITYDELIDLIDTIKQNHIDTIPLYREQFLWITTFNYIIDVMVRTYKVENLTAFKIDYSDLEEIIARINSRITDMLLYKFMPFGMGKVDNAGVKLEKVREDFLKIFPFITNTVYEPDAASKVKASEYIKDTKNFRSLSPSMELFYILFGMRNQ